MALIKALVVNFLIISASFAVGVFVVEGLLRILPVSLTGVNTEIPLVADPDIAFIRKGGESARNESACFSASISTNSLGFRDDEWTDDQSIVVLGDSYMEAVQVGDTQHFSAILESLLGVPVANLGRSSFGTVAELATFKKFGAPLNPELVVLAFYANNDIDDNNCNGSQGPHGTITKPCGEIQGDGTVSFPKNFYSMSGDHTVRAFLREQCHFCRLVKDFLTKKEVVSIRGGEISREVAALYLPQDTAHSTIEDSWHLTEEALRELKAAVDMTGAKLVIMSVPEFLLYTSDPRESYGERYGGAKVPDDFNPLEPVDRAEAIAKDLNIPFFRLEDAFVSYRDKYQLRYPFLSYRCDGHWNPLGHVVAATAFTKLLLESGVLPPDIAEDVVLTKAQHLFETIPESILGSQGAHEIYEDGVYQAP